MFVVFMKKKSFLIMNQLNRLFTNFNLRFVFYVLQENDRSPLVLKNKWIEVTLFIYNNSFTNEKNIWNAKRTNKRSKLEKYQQKYTKWPKIAIILQTKFQNTGKCLDEQFLFLVSDLNVHSVQDVMQLDWQENNECWTIFLSFEDKVLVFLHQPTAIGSNQYSKQAANTKTFTSKHN